MREQTIQKIEKSYAGMYQNHQVPAPIKRCASLILFRFGINGLCDGMYIANTIAVVSGFGNGCGHFVECKRMSERFPECAAAIAEDIQSTYCSLIPEENKTELAEIIRSQNLNDSEAMRGMRELISTYENQTRNSDCEEWRKEYLGNVMKQLRDHIAQIKEDHTHRAEIIIDAKEAAYIRKILSTEPENGSECFGEDEKISHTAVFDDGMQMDVQVCGVQFIENDDDDDDDEEVTGDSNLPWTQAVLYNKYGGEAGCSDAEDEYFGKWELENGDEIYIVTVSDAQAGANAA